MEGMLSIRVPSLFGRDSQARFVFNERLCLFRQLGAKPTAGWRFVRSERSQYLLEIRSESDQIGVFSTHESRVKHPVGHHLDRLEEPIYVKERARFRVDTQPGPTPLFKDLFQGADPSGKGDKTVGQFGHFCFSFVHGLNDKQLRKPNVCNFLVHQGTRDHADHFAASGERRVSNDPHQARSPSAVDQLTAAFREPLAKRSRGVCICRVAPRTGSTENAYTHAGCFHTPQNLSSCPHK